jgi:hypothetical protein
MSNEQNRSQTRNYGAPAKHQLRRLSRFDPVLAAVARRSSNDRNGSPWSVPQKRMSG